MREEMDPNQDVVLKRQTEKVIQSQGRPVNTPRRQVSPARVILWYAMALLALTLWVLRLYGVISAPF